MTTKPTKRPRAVLSVHTDPDTSDRLSTIASYRRQTKSAVVGEAIERFVAEEGRLIARVEAGLADADQGHHIANETIGSWLRSVGTDRELPAPHTDGV